MTAGDVRDGHAAATAISEPILPLVLTSQLVNDDLAPSEALELYGRHADELAAIVETARTQELQDYREQLTRLQREHERRMALLALLTNGLGEQTVELDEVAHQLARHRWRPVSATQTRCESIPVPGGPPYVARLDPVVELIAGDKPTVVVVHTHDYYLAAELAWPLWSHEHGGPLPCPVRRWWRPIPTEGPDGQFANTWWPARPGDTEAVPVIEFPLHAGPTSPKIEGPR